jgi:hypothetical protein
MNLFVPPEDLAMFLTMIIMAGFVTSYICYQRHRNRKLDYLLKSNESLQDTIKKQGVAVNKLLDLVAQSLGDTEL